MLFCPTIFAAHDRTYIHILNYLNTAKYSPTILFVGIIHSSFFYPLSIRYFTRCSANSLKTFRDAIEGSRLRRYFKQVLQVPMGIHNVHFMTLLLIQPYEKDIMSYFEKQRWQKCETCETFGAQTLWLKC